MLTACFKSITSVRMIDWTGLELDFLTENRDWNWIGPTSNQHQPGWGHLSSSTSKLAVYMLLYIVLEVA
jgi:hypothetical protein